MKMANRLIFFSRATGAMAEGTDDADRNVEMWKIKKLIKSLEAARG